MNFTTQAIQLIADAKIESAMKAGEFDNLPGFGKPLEGDLLTHDPYWWVRKKIKRENMPRLFDPRPILKKH